MLGSRFSLCVVSVHAYIEHCLSSQNVAGVFVPVLVSSVFRLWSIPIYSSFKPEAEERMLNTDVRPEF